MEVKMIKVSKYQWPTLERPADDVIVKQLQEAAKLVWHTIQSRRHIVQIRTGTQSGLLEKARRGRKT